MGVVRLHYVGAVSMSGECRYFGRSGHVLRDDGVSQWAYSYGAPYDPMTVQGWSQYLLEQVSQDLVDWGVWVLYIGVHGQDVPLLLVP